MSSVISKKLKFKGDKPKKKKRSHHHEDEGGEEELNALAAADPRGWIFPSDVLDINGPSFIILPSDPISCLAWDPTRQKVYASPIDLPEAPEGANELSPREVLANIEPSDVNHVWVISRLSGSEGVVSLRSSTGTFLTAHPSGTLSASTPSRGALESFIPSLTSSSSSSSSSFPNLSLKTYSEKYLSTSTPTGPSTNKNKHELRADADEIGLNEVMRVKCQREFVFKAKMDRDIASGVMGGDESGKRRIEGGFAAGSLEDEVKRNKDAQTWGVGRIVVSEGDRRDIKKARKEGRLAEAMLDRRAALKSDRYAK